MPWRLHRRTARLRWLLGWRSTVDRIPPPRGQDLLIRFTSQPAGELAAAIPRKHDVGVSVDEAGHHGGAGGVVDGKIEIVGGDLPLAPQPSDRTVDDGDRGLLNDAKNATTARIVGKRAAQYL